MSVFKLYPEQSPLRRLTKAANRGTLVVTSVSCSEPQSLAADPAAMAGLDDSEVVFCSLFLAPFPYCFKTLIRQVLDDKVGSRLLTPVKSCEDYLRESVR
jgi:hypothetical protein